MCAGRVNTSINFGQPKCTNWSTTWAACSFTRLLCCSTFRKCYTKPGCKRLFSWLVEIGGISIDSSDTVAISPGSALHRANDSLLERVMMNPPPAPVGCRYGQWHGGSGLLSTFSMYASYRGGKAGRWWPGKVAFEIMNVWKGKVLAALPCAIVLVGKLAWLLLMRNSDVELPVLHFSAENF